MSHTPRNSDALRLLSIEQTADRLGISRSGVYRLVARGELATVTLGRRTLIEGLEIRRIIRANRSTTRDEVKLAS